MKRDGGEADWVAPPRFGEGAGAKLLARLPLIGNRMPAPGSPGMIALTISSLVALVAVAVVFRRGGSFLFLGALIGILAAVGVPSAKAGLKPMADIARAAAPLGVALLVVVASGTVSSPLLLQLAVGVIGLLIAWHLLIAPEWDAPDNPLLDGDRRTRGSLRRQVALLAQVAGPLLLVGVALTFGIVPLLDVLEDRGEIAVKLFFAAAGLFVLAAVMRLVGFARTRLRALVAVALAVALARLAMEGGLLPLHGWLTENVAWLTADNLLKLAGLTVVVAAVAEIAISVLLTREAAAGFSGARARLAAQLEAPLMPRSFTARIGAYGLVASVVAAVVLLLAVVAATTAGGAKEQFDEVTLEPIRPGRPSQPPRSIRGDETLAAMYSPLLVFTEHQRWSPTKVDRYLSRATIRNWHGQVRRAPAVDRLPSECPGIVLKPCYRLTIGCESADDPCSMSRPAAVGEARRDEAVYVRVERRADWERRSADSGAADAEPQRKLLDDGSPNPFGDVGPYGRTTRFLLQYWYFYPYDEWVAPVLGGRFKQRHEADWEAVTIGLDDAGPLFVAYSEHCGGTWSHWRDIRVAEDQRSRLRPLVAVAEGSQANYRVAEVRRAPDWAKCAGVPADLLTLLSYASNIRDRTDSKWSWEPAEHLLVTARTPPMNFVGVWGPYSRTTLENFRTGQKLGRDQAGPATPTLQRLWREPMKTIFGGGNWHHE